MRREKLRWRGKGRKGNLERHKSYETFCSHVKRQKSNGKENYLKLLVRKTGKWIKRRCWFFNWKTDVHILKIFPVSEHYSRPIFMLENQAKSIISIQFPSILCITFVVITINYRNTSCIVTSSLQECYIHTHSITHICVRTYMYIHTWVSLSSIYCQWSRKRCPPFIVY